MSAGLWSEYSSMIFTAGVNAENEAPEKYVGTLNKTTNRAALEDLAQLVATGCEQGRAAGRLALFSNCADCKLFNENPLLVVTVKPEQDSCGRATRPRRPRRPVLHQAWRGGARPFRW